MKLKRLFLALVLTFAIYPGSSEAARPEGCGEACFELVADTSTHPAGRWDLNHSDGNGDSPGYIALNGFQLRLIGKRVTQPIWRSTTKVKRLHLALTPVIAILTEKSKAARSEVFGETFV